ncbi:MAG: LacI family DNA-binding transcriptional regulator [Parasporobacterium sp.]|nr:LacI family DNA-binding transcriptional regulator [Parasporobacterium sp.]
MGITAKEIAKKLGLSATAVSMALRNKPGVSTDTKRLIIETAEKYGYDFSRFAYRNVNDKSIYVISYRTHNAILSYSPIFDELLEGIDHTCRKQNYKLKVMPFYEKKQDVNRFLEDLRISDCGGIILFGTESSLDIIKKFTGLPFPIVMLDTYFESISSNYVLINNSQGAYLAADYLISTYMDQPGYLASSYGLQNFHERFRGFSHALKDNGMSAARSSILKLAPTIEGAMADMQELLEQNVPLSRCYFADNDLIAIGAIKALKKNGFRIPEDVAVVGFDDISEGRVIEPALTTINIPRHFMGKMAANRLINLMNNINPESYKVEVATSLIRRGSA